ncbi:alpha/beta fold hydrolase [Paraburkholderia elongata]|uniref:esterase n=1 Tax=Paraburkholderia elongata TaxID=2675747 RepID=UPI002E28A0D6|nr:esterase [Paraburkholderia elongata]
MSQTTEHIVQFTADDGQRCNLIHSCSGRTPDKGPVLLVHGAGVRANIFRPPVPTTFVDFLLAHGYDVWLENWRASIDLPPNEWTLDQAALYDHPAAVRKVVEETGSPEIKAVIHCQGSTSFTMSAVAGLIPQVTTILSNAVSLHPIVPWISRQKGRFAVPVVSRLTPYLNPQWGEHASGVVPRLLQGLVKLTHHECDNGVCRFSSFTFGTGFPVLWRHENLNPAIHDWIRGEFGNVPFSFFRQMSRCLDAGHLVSNGGFPGLPQDFAAEPPRTTARFAFIAGELNQCFLWQSQQESFKWFDRQRPNHHSLHVLRGYGHLDVFIGKNALHDTFPVLLAELEREI